MALREAAKRGMKACWTSKACETWSSNVLPASTMRTAASTAYTVGDSTNIKWHEGSVSREEREKLLDQRGCVLWFTGLSGSGKSTVAYTLEHALAERGKLAYVLDGDNIRHGLNQNLGFTAADREENIRRIGEVSKLFAESGMITLVSFISPYRADRDRVRQRLAPGDFVEVYMKIPLEVCESRDPKGLYKAARAGKIKGFTGIDDPYEEPLQPELAMEVSKADGVMKAPEKMAGDILAYLESNGYLSCPKNR
uniref:Adenylyl-sulfate kinase n=1 Tax=Picocystis salinarum TaxID=88271 RepID=A0A7S3XCL8_9CHLO